VDLERPVRAACVVVFDDSIQDWVKAVPAMRELMGLCGASGLLIAPETSCNGDYLTELVWTLSHDQPLSRAVRPGLLMAHRALVDKSRISRYLTLVAEDLQDLPRTPVDLDPGLASQLGLRMDAPPEADDVGNRILEAMRTPSLLFGSESRGASYTVQL